ncbi:flavodoxin FldA [Candidatus Pantoea edessiphila]|uniref:Flavodoxin n=1 Tax=Candidatus Pantoea edessiphila TaxID=2044610 RepID=A0A2P5SYZ9_9GAMM|nr:flavodoxin FldA [Candidatus Pantoea edessiphila]MBK4775294.1 flavodoxin FldA [Pantoea sp. Edef]PPI87568.1 flavodoxin FldA [Candidatus Pantoea edessiphila]
MTDIGIFFGSDTGNTENIAQMIQQQIGNKATIYDIADISKEDMEIFDIILIGSPTWYYGEVQCDWDDFLPTLKKINFKNKIVGLFGCGDQEDYTEYFCDAIGIIHNIVLSNNATIIGHWSNEGYSFEASKALLNEKKFLGLAIDEDRQPELTKNRVNKWVNQVLNECKNTLNNINV